ncbi:related to triose phosphate/3-phosphoglycerate/phosphate translocator [Rhynchosporium secalis]|uniref:Related to triose phosphate/3-phosphoglycerate/phosphate translocator n=1 Tax=Rhynchosporium secalis TaxID=38038 RepID=A0A1E1M6D0_RHYSE|nr:related to triose phosphate/3-phosphoglycerate/phosphate translocator [Rhynchosporium secalis]
MNKPKREDEDLEMSKTGLVDGEIHEDKDKLSADPPKPQSMKSKIVDMLCILLNIASTVTLVFLNKWIFKDSQLKNMQITFAMWHFTCTTIVLYIASRSPFNLFVPVRLPFMQMIPLCSFFAGFLILGNLSLAYNSIGFYQLAKIMTTPCVAVLQYFFMGKTVAGLTIVALAAVCIGVSLTNSNAAGTTTAGASIAVAAFTVTAFYQVWIGKKIVDFKVSSPQLLLNQAPISVLLLLFVAPFSDTMADVSQIPNNTLVALFLSGLAAAALNLSQFLIIGRMSALTFNVASNVKTIIILTYGWVSEGRVFTVKDGIGIILALGGATLYSQLSQN